MTLDITLVSTTNVYTSFIGVDKGSDRRSGHLFGALCRPALPCVHVVCILLVVRAYGAAKLMYFYDFGQLAAGAAFETAAESGLDPSEIHTAAVFIQKSHSVRAVCCVKRSSHSTDDVQQTHWPYQSIGRTSLMVRAARFLRLEGPLWSR